jgi:hypothetical protein
MAKHRTLYCHYCDQERSFRKPRLNHVQCLALSIITLGVYLIPWSVATWRRMRSPWRSRVCSRSYRGEAAEQTPASRSLRSDLAEFKPRLHAQH